MPEKKIIEAVMSTLPVIGSSIATATAGPMPGSTPTAVPRAQPMRHHRRLMGVIAAAKPVMRALRMSMSGLPLGCPEGRLCPLGGQRIPDVMSVGVHAGLTLGRPEGGPRPLGGQRIHGVMSVGVHAGLPLGRPEGGPRPLGGQRIHGVM